MSMNYYPLWGTLYYVNGKSILQVFFCLPLLSVCYCLVNSRICRDEVDKFHFQVDTLSAHKVDIVDIVVVVVVDIAAGGTIAAQRTAFVVVVVAVNSAGGTQSGNTRIKFCYKKFSDHNY